MKFLKSTRKVPQAAKKTKRNEIDKFTDIRGQMIEKVKCEVKDEFNSGCTFTFDSLLECKNQLRNNQNDLNSNNVDNDIEKSDDTIKSIRSKDKLYVKHEKNCVSSTPPSLCYNRENFEQKSNRNGKEKNAKIIGLKMKGLSKSRVKKPIQYKCSNCKYSSEKLYNYQRHLLRDYCRKYKKYLIQNVSTSNIKRNEKYKCDKCHYSTKSCHHFHKHLKADHESKFMKYAHKYANQNISKSNIKRMTYKCNDPLIAKNKDSNSKIKNKTRQLSKYNCPTCPFSSSRKYDIYNHRFLLEYKKYHQPKRNRSNKSIVSEMEVKSSSSKISLSMPTMKTRALTAKLTELEKNEEKLKESYENALKEHDLLYKKDEQTKHGFQKLQKENSDLLKRYMQQQKHNNCKTDLSSQYNFAENFVQESDSGTNLLHRNNLLQKNTLLREKCRKIVMENNEIQRRQNEIKEMYGLEINKSKSINEKLTNIEKEFIEEKQINALYHEIFSNQQKEIAQLQTKYMTIQIPSHNFNESQIMPSKNMDQKIFTSTNNIESPNVVKESVLHDENAKGKPEISSTHIKSLESKNIDGISHVGRNRHKKREHAAYGCNQCKFRSVKLYNVMRHLAAVHKDGSVLLCNKCKYATRSENLLDLHINVCHLKHPRISNQMKKKSFEPRCVRDGITKIGESKGKHANYGCCQCGFRNSKMSRMMRHLAVAHKDVSVLLCATCHYATKNENSLVEHVKLCHSKHKKTSKLENSSSVQTNGAIHKPIENKMDSTEPSTNVNKIICTSSPATYHLRFKAK